MLFQSVGLKPMWGRVEVVTAYSTDEALGLKAMKDVRVKAGSVTSSTSGPCLAPMGFLTSQAEQKQVFIEYFKGRHGLIFLASAKVSANNIPS